MRNFIVALGLVLLGGSTQAQDQKTYPTVGTVKSVDSKGVPVNSTKNQEQEKEVSQPKTVIIQTLEYKLEETNVKVDETNNASTSVAPTGNEATGTTVIEEPVKTIDEQIADVEANIQAIDTKVEWIKNHPKQHENALATGWYEQMENNKKTLLEKKQELINSKK